MSSAHSYTLIPADDDDDSDICPVCDGECTCKAPAPPPPQQRPRPAPGVPLSMAELSLRYAASSPNSPSSGPLCPSPSLTTSSSPASPPPAPKPSLKIKLTVPPGLLAKRKLPPPSSSTATPTPPPSSASASSAPQRPKTHSAHPLTTSAVAPTAYTSIPSTYTKTPSAYTNPFSSKKQRGRPPIAHTFKSINQKSTAPGKHPRTAAAAASKVRRNLKARAGAKKAASKRRRMVSSDSESTSSSEFSDVEMSMHRHSAYADDDAESGTFPTFVSASALSSLSSDSADSSSALSDLDSDVEAEEETFIRADVQRRARAAHNGDWVIRPRKKSVGLSDAEMEIDTDATDDEDADAEDDGDETEEDLTASALLAPAPSMDEDESADERQRYTGHATGWSDDDDDESSFDADLFFANLSGDSGSSSSSDSDSSVRAPTHLRRGKARRTTPLASMGEDGDQSDISAGTDGARSDRAPTSLPFEVTEGWDGQLVFTNGNAETAHIVDVEFEADVRGFGGAGCSADGGCESAHVIEMELHDEDEEDEEEDDGYVEESGGDASGDTTDEELVGPDDLPNERAMRLFNLPMSVSAIDPLSTVSSPAVSPGRMRSGSAPGLGFGFGRNINRGPPAHGGKGYVPGWDIEAEKRERERERRRRMWGGESVRAQDILEGRVLFWDSDEQEHDRDDVRERWGGRRSESGTEESNSDSEGGSSHGRRRRARTPRGPRQGVFVPTSETRQAVIGEKQKGAAVPSPHPRFKGRGGRRGGGRFSAVEHLLRRHLLQSITASGASLDLGNLNLNNQPAHSSVPQSPAETADMCASLDLLFSSAAQVLSGGEDGMAMDVDAQGGSAEPIQLDDVLDAAFLDDSAPAADEGSPAPEEAVDAAGAPARWDHMSVGAFRQTRWDTPAPGSGADLGSAMRPAPIGAMLWQTQSSRAVKGIKHAKRRQMMVGAAGMSSPLVLPSASTSNSSIASPALSAKDRERHHHHQQEQQQQQKSRRELRRERKVMKKALKVHGGAAVHQHTHPHAHAHQFHSHHHHPNSKLRGAGATQRSNFFSGSVPPLNL